MAFEGPKLAVIGTGKRTGKTAVAGHWATLLDGLGADPVVVCMGRGGPAEPLAAADTDLEQLRIADAGGHAASDFLEDAVVAGVRTVGCRRVGGACRRPRAVERAGRRRARRLTRAGRDHVRGVGACIPPVEVDRTVCVLGAGAPEPFAEYRLARAQLVLAAPGAQAPPTGALPFELRPEPLEPIPGGARVALFTTGAPSLAGVDPRVSSTNLARRSAGGGPRTGRRGGL